MGFHISSSSLSGSHPHAQLFPFLHQGESSTGGSYVAFRGGSYRTCPSVSGLLQPSLCSVENLRVVEACHRPLAAELSRHPNTEHGGTTGWSSIWGTITFRSMLIPILASFFISWHSRCHTNSRPLFRSLHGSAALHAGLAPVSAMLHHRGIRMLRYLDYLTRASSRTNTLWAKDEVHSLCRDLGIVVNLPKSHLVPTQPASFLGMYLVSPTLRAFPSQERVSALLMQIEGFLSCRWQCVISWHSLLGCLLSLCLLFPGGRLHMRSLQLVLCSRVGLFWRVGDSGVVSVDPGRPSLVVKHLQPSALCFPRGGLPRPSLLVRRIRPRVGRTSTRPFRFSPLVSSRTLPFDKPSGALRDPPESIPLRHQVRRLVVGLFADNTTALSYVRKLGGPSPQRSTWRPSFSFIGQRSGRSPWFPNSLWGPRMWSPTPWVANIRS